MNFERTNRPGRPAGPGPGRPTGPDPLLALRKRVLRHRRGVAAALVGLAVLLFAQALRPPEAATVPIVTAATTLPAGHVIKATDLRVVGWPADHRPAGGFTDTTELVGRITLTAVDPGEALGPNRVLSPGVLDGAGGLTGPNGSRMVAIAVRLADPGEARLLRPGDLIDVLAARGAGPIVPGHDEPGHEDAGATTAETIARAVRVLAIPRAGDDGGDGLLGGGGGGSSQSGTLIVLAVDEPTSRRIAAAAANSRLSVAVLPQTATRTAPTPTATPATPPPAPTTPAAPQGSGAP